MHFMLYYRCSQFFLPLRKLLVTPHCHKLNTYSGLVFCLLGFTIPCLYAAEHDHRHVAYIFSKVSRLQN